jgi:hypothetical protein
MDRAGKEAELADRAAVTAEAVVKAGEKYRKRKYASPALDVDEKLMFRVDDGY